MLAVDALKMYHGQKLVASPFNLTHYQRTWLAAI